MKISFNKLIILITSIILVVAICIGIILKTNSNKNTPKNETKKEEISSNSLNNGYNGKELGTKVKFTKNDVNLPEKVESGYYNDNNDNTWYYDLDKDGNAINVYVYSDDSGSGEFTGDVAFPSEINGHKIISIGKNMVDRKNTLFYVRGKGEEYWDKITSITVPEGVKYINGGAFYGYDNLEKVTLPDSIIYIGDEAFQSSKNLAYINSDIEGKIVMPKNLQSYGESLFRYNKKINDFEFPEQIDFIQDWTFYETSGFSDVVISKQFKYVGAGAFAETNIKTLTIEDGVQIIEASAFSNNTKLRKADIAKSVISIGQGAFDVCSNLEEFNYNGKLQYIGANVFKNSKNENYIKSNQLP